MLLSAFLVAWGAEAAQFLISQGLALALLAWLQTSPEFAVEAVIAWEAGKDPARAHLAIANLTGAIRLLLGLGWPLIYFVFAFSGRKDGTQRLPSITLERQHAIEIIGLIPPLLYFLVIIAKQAFGWIDAVVLIALYAGYLAVLLRTPPHAAEALEDAPAVSRWAYRQRGWRRPLVIGGLFAVGGGLLYATAHPFLESMLAVAGLLGFSQFFLVPWVAPFLSEFPEFGWLDATILLVLWLAQFLVPHWREEVAVAYGIWIVVLVIGFAVGGKRLLAPRYFLETLRRR